MRIGFISTRFAGVDGVSLERPKLAQLFAELGHESFFIAGQLDADVQPGWLVPEMHFQHPTASALHQAAFSSPRLNRFTCREIYAQADFLQAKLEAFIEEFQIDVLMPQNACAIPLNLSLGLAIEDTIKRNQIKALCHHHDFYWERERFVNNGVQDILNSAFPPNLQPVRHLVINTPMQRRLWSWRGIPSLVLPNCFDFETPAPQPDAYALTLRTELGLSADDLIVLQPTRVVRRKGIEYAIELMHQLNDPRLVLLITGYEGDEPSNYGGWLRQQADRAGIRYHFIGEFVGATRGQQNGHRVYTLWDLYPQAHFVTYPSIYEGFGNALLETIYFRKPFIVHTYPVYLSDIKPAGIKAIEFYYDLTAEVLRQTRDLIDNAGQRDAMTAHNYAVALEHFSYKVERAILARALEDLTHD